MDSSCSETLALWQDYSYTKSFFLPDTHLDVRMLTIPILSRVLFFSSCWIFHDLKVLVLCASSWLLLSSRTWVDSISSGTISVTTLILFCNVLFPNGTHAQHEIISVDEPSHVTCNHCISILICPNQLHRSWELKSNTSFLSLPQFEPNMESILAAYWMLA